MQFGVCLSICNIIKKRIVLTALLISEENNFRIQEILDMMI
jgi:hypothetical protein